MVIIDLSDAGGLSKALAEHQVVIVQNLATDTNKQLLQLARSLGELSDCGITSRTNALEDRYIHLVNDRPSPSIDPFGNKMLSTTNAFFPLHTDEYFAPVPARYVFLLCVRPNETGGESLVSKLDDFLGLLSEGAVSALSQPVFPSQAGRVAVLMRNAGTWTVRYNELEMQRAVRGGFAPPISEYDGWAIQCLQAAAEAVVDRHLLRTGECLVVRNHHAFHGRTAFPAGSQRLLKRVRIK